MAGSGTTTLDLARWRGTWRDRVATLAGTVPSAGAPAGSRPAGSRLTETVGFGSNPGNLRMMTYVPEALPVAPAVVVVLHGCGQDASGYDHGAGWSELAERHGFALLCPEQVAANNPKACFTWFLPADTTRGSGEVLSIRQMVERAAVDLGIDRTRVFVTGLSAGGAMAAALLATYPEVFAGGGIVAGLPYGSARTVQGAFQAMFDGIERPAPAWGDLVRAASDHPGPWPRLSIWHGDADTTVRPVNARQLALQWSDLHGLAAAPPERDMLDGQPREVWRDAGGRAVVESVTIRGMGHGTPLRVGPGQDACGEAGPFLLDVGVSSTIHMAGFWGLAASEPRIARPAVPARPAAPDPRPEPPASPRAKDVGTVITDALRAAGLMRS